ncbi:Membrane-spanning 4-domains subfamily A member 14 [Galemys pyrenaicus]|uniref:Membrane-spanning 4-domains subfamily A member 14 n=1 Tax=Galemys pyrenaicus TaxID=202257 RepID=A0A8J5ZQW5_GALPY|nr:Membrane-spanning 4-domains subfamily A member 14 [Galemys pyrenaicus]
MFCSQTYRLQQNLQGISRELHGEAVSALPVDLSLSSSQQFVLAGYISANSKMDKRVGQHDSFITVISSLVAVAGIVLTLISYRHQPVFCQQPSLEEICVVGRRLFNGILSVLLIISIVELSISVTIASFKSKCWTRSNEVCSMSYENEFLMGLSKVTSGMLVGKQYINVFPTPLVFQIVFFLPSDLAQDSELSVTDENAILQFELHEESSRTDSIANIQPVFFGGYTFYKLRLSRSPLAIQQSGKKSSNNYYVPSINVPNEQQKNRPLSSKLYEAGTGVKSSHSTLAKTASGGNRKSKQVTDEDLKLGIGQPPKTHMQLSQDQSLPHQVLSSHHVQVQALPPQGLSSQFLSAQTLSVQKLLSEVSKSQIKKSLSVFSDDKPFQDLLFQDKTFQGRPSQVRAPEDRASQEVTYQGRPSQARASQARASEDRASQARASEDRASQARASEDRASQARASEDRASQVRASQDTTSQVRASQDTTSQVRASQDTTSQVRASQDTTSQVRASQDTTYQVRASQDTTSQGRAYQDLPSEDQLSTPAQKTMVIETQATLVADSIQHVEKSDLKLQKVVCDDQEGTHIVYQDLESEVMLLTQGWTHKAELHSKRYSKVSALGDKGRQSPKRRSLERYLRGRVSPKKFSEDKYVQVNQDQEKQPSDEQAKYYLVPSDQSLKEQPPSGEDEEEAPRQEQQAQEDKYENWPVTGEQAETQEPPQQPAPDSGMQDLQQYQSWMAENWKSTDWKAQELQLKMQSQLKMGTEDWQAEALLEKELLQQNALFQEAEGAQVVARKQIGPQLQSVPFRYNHYQDKDQDLPSRGIQKEDMQTRDTRREEMKLESHCPSGQSSLQTCLSVTDSERNGQLNISVCSSSYKADVPLTSTSCYTKEQSEDSD